MQSNTFVYFLFTALSLFIGTAYADEEKNEPVVVYKQKTEIDFEGVEVEGQLLKPNAAVITERQIAKFNPLIKLRTDFDDEMNATVNEIK